MEDGIDSQDCRLSEFLAALSLATDLGLGQPMEHVLRSCVIGANLSMAADLSDQVRAAVCSVGLLAWVGCIADSHEMAAAFGDDIRFRADSHEVDLAGLPLAAFVIANAGAGGSLWRRGRLAATSLIAGREGLARSIRSHCETTGSLAGRLGLGPEVCVPLLHVFERWDGKGLPVGLKGEQADVVARVVTMAGILEVFERIGGRDGAVEVARRRRGKQFDPYLVDCFSRDPHSVLVGSVEAMNVETVVGACPALARRLSGNELDMVLEAVADFTDLKSPFALGHSRGVADLAAEAGHLIGLGEAEVVRLRRAALVHDLGQQGISSAIWDKAAPLTTAERERVRLHPYLVERILARSSTLAPLGALASLHHERLDGSGYPRGLSGAGLSPSARVLATADAYHAMLEPRPNRDARAPEEAARELRGEAHAGRLDPAAVDAVLAAAGHRVGRRRPWPDELTAREIEILVLVARANSNRAIAQRLHITDKTVGNHIEHIYGKIGCTSRAGAALYAMQHGLLADVQPDREEAVP
ncbi:MAG: HD domain-containing phosphohydrolase [Candidatus Dormibacter sp.]